MGKDIRPNRGLRNLGVTQGSILCWFSNAQKLWQTCSYNQAQLGPFSRSYTQWSSVFSESLGRHQHSCYCWWNAGLRRWRTEKVSPWWLSVPGCQRASPGKARTLPPGQQVSVLTAAVHELEHLKGLSQYVRFPRINWESVDQGLLLYLQNPFPSPHNSINMGVTSLRCCTPPWLEVSYNPARALRTWVIEGMRLILEFWLPHTFCWHFWPWDHIEGRNWRSFVEIGRLHLKNKSFGWGVWSCWRNRGN